VSYLKTRMLKLRCLCWLKVQMASLLRYNNASTFSCFLHLSGSLLHILPLQTLYVAISEIYIDGCFVYYIAL
jgi:hypothetical protein